MINPQNEDGLKFPLCEYRARFGDYHNMDDPAYWNVYPRTVAKRHPDNVKNYQYTFLPRKEQTKELAKAGTFFNAFHFKAHKKSIKPSAGAMPPVDAGMTHPARTSTRLLAPHLHSIYPNISDTHILYYEPYQ